MRHVFVVVYENLYTGQRMTKEVETPSADWKESRELFVQEDFYVRSREYQGIRDEREVCATAAIQKGGLLV